MIIVATSKQDKALKILVESGGDMPVSKAMEKAGYSPATAKTPQKLTESNAYKSFFPPDKTQQVVDNLHKLSISAEDQKIQVDATKEWLSHAVPKEKGNTFNNFGTVVAEMKDKYAD